MMMCIFSSVGHKKCESKYDNIYYYYDYDDEMQFIFNIYIKQRHKITRNEMCTCVPHNYVEERCIDNRKKKKKDTVLLSRERERERERERRRERRRESKMQQRCSRDDCNRWAFSGHKMCVVHLRTDVVSKQSVSALKSAVRPPTYPQKHTHAHTHTHTHTSTETS